MTTLWEKTGTHDWVQVHVGNSEDDCKNQCKRLMSTGYQACKRREYEIRGDGVAYLRTNDSGSVFRMQWNWA